MTLKIIQKTAEERSNLPARDRLLYYMMIKRQWAYNKGWLIEKFIDFCWWGSRILFGISSVAGIVATVPAIKSVFAVQPWMISVTTLFAGGLELTRRNAHWRAKSNAYYAHRDRLRTLIGVLEYRTENQEGASISAISAQFDEEEKRLGADLQRINTSRDDDGAVRSSSVAPPPQ